MKTHRWRDIAEARVGKDRLAELETEAKEEMSTFRELRESLGITQSELAKLAEITQSQVSKFEQRDDHYISRMREMVEAMGGELEVIAVVGDKRVRVA